MTLPLGETELLKRWGNHGEFARKLRELGLVSDLAILSQHVEAVGVSWFRLGREHLEEAKRALAAGMSRATYSRAYYAAYSCSKSIRFLVKGAVSLQGDDHRMIGKLPSDFPDSARWASDLESLYDDRLRADYDNWIDTVTKFNRTPAAAVATAIAFEGVATTYLVPRLKSAL